jgi:hypothetical protein
MPAARQPDVRARGRQRRRHARCLGYEQIKIASVDRYRAQLHAALAALNQI